MKADSPKSTRVCWLAEVEFETGVRNDYTHEPGAIRRWLLDAIEMSGSPTIAPSGVRITGLLIQKPTEPRTNPKPKKKKCPKHPKIPLSAGGECSLCGNYY